MSTSGRVKLMHCQLSSGHHTCMSVGEVLNTPHSLHAKSISLNARTANNDGLFMFTLHNYSAVDYVGSPMFLK